MAKTHEDLQRPEAPRSAPTTAAASRVDVWQRLDFDGWRRLVGWSWVLLFAVLLLLEPVPADPDASIGLVAALLQTATLGLMGLTAFGLTMRRRWGFAASIGAGVLLTAGVVLCPVSGHHTFGLWWAGQLACCAGILGTSALGLQRA